jgi:pyridoxal phosphate enzyme (YggS family)
MISTPDLLRNYDKIIENIEILASRYSRSPNSVTLVAVSKTHPEQLIRTLYEHRGHLNFGENYVKELVQKAESLADLPDLIWHFIGRLQSNKIHLVSRYADSIHCVETLEQVVRINQALVVFKDRAKVNCFLGFNLGSDENKSGAKTFANLSDLKLSIDRESLDQINVAGVMGIAPLAWGGEPLDFVVKEYKKWIDQAHSIGLQSVSLGMTGDMEAAIAAGSTHLRIGTAIFGSRI